MADRDGLGLSANQRQALVRRIADRITRPHSDHHQLGDTAAEWKARAALAEVEARLVDLGVAKSALASLSSQIVTPDEVRAMNRLAELAVEPIGDVSRVLMRHFDVDPDVFIGMHGNRGHFDDAAKAVIRAMLDGVEPVAWRYHFPGDLEHGWQRHEFERRIQSYEGMTCNEEDAGCIETPLYSLDALKETTDGAAG